MKIVTFEMPIGVARARAKKWWLKASNVDFIYNANKTKARLVINADKQGDTMKEIPIFRYDSISHKASIIELQGGVFVLIHEDASGIQHEKRFQNLEHALHAYERVFNCKVDMMQWDLEFDSYFYD